MRIGLFSIVGIIILVGVYWAGTRNLIGGAVAAVRGG